MTILYRAILSSWVIHLPLLRLPTSHPSPSSPFFFKTDKLFFFFKLLHWLTLCSLLQEFTFDSCSSESQEGGSPISRESSCYSAFLTYIWVLLRKTGERNIFLTDIHFCEQSTNILFWVLVINGPKAFFITSGVSYKCPWANGSSNVFSLMVVTFSHLVANHCLWISYFSFVVAIQRLWIILSFRIGKHCRNIRSTFFFFSLLWVLGFFLSFLLFSQKNSQRNFGSWFYRILQRKKYMSPSYSPASSMSNKSGLAWNK